MKRTEITDLIVAARISKGLTWNELAEAIGKPPVWTTAALLGQHPFTPEDAATLSEILDLPEVATAVLTTIPYRGGLPTAVPTDPTIYRLYEALQVYGPALKELIHEEFGDGIMSAINFKLDLGRTQHADAEHIVITFDGKFLPYAWPTD